MLHIFGYYQDRGDMDRAGALTAMLGEPLLGLDDSPSWRGRIHYNMACDYSRQGKTEEALAELAEALALVPSLKEWSQEDADLDSIREEPAYQALYED